MLLSQAIQDYLKTIFAIQEENTVVTTTDIARAMNVSAASVTGMIKRLDRMKLVVHKSYKGVSLTEAGEKIALEIIRHHRLLETYLREIMGYSWEKMHDEAEHLEHHISEEFEERIDALLDYPTHDPHGHPIPTQDLKMSRAETITLSEAPPDQPLVIHHLSDADTTLLHLLERIGLMPRCEILVIGREDGKMTVWVGNRKESIRKEVADNVHVIVR